MRRSALFVPAVLGLLLTGCSVRGSSFDPTVVVLGSGGEELGVSTPYGVVYLGHNVADERVRLVPAFGDGPGVERANSQEVARGLKLAEAAIELPTVPICFNAPAPGSTVIVKGRDGVRGWQEEATVASVPGAKGLVLRADGSLRRRMEAGVVGPGVYTRDDEGNLLLLGLLDGVFEKDGTNYLAVAGPGHLWRAAAFDKKLGRTRWVYREDVL